MFALTTFLVYTSKIQLRKSGTLEFHGSHPEIWASNGEYCFKLNFVSPSHPHPTATGPPLGQIATSNM